MTDTPLPQITVPSFCYDHQYAIVHECRYGEDDAWQVLLVVMGLALFGVIIDDPNFTEGLPKDEEGKFSIVAAGEALKEMGCLGGVKPRTLEHCIAMVKEQGLSAVAKAVKAHAIVDQDLHIGPEAT